MDDEPRFSRRQLLAGAGTALAGGLAGCTLVTPRETDENPGDPAENTSDTEAIDEFPDEFDRPGENPDEPDADGGLTDIYRDIVDSVVAVRIEAAEGTSGGTAWVYDDTHLVTNEHVVRDVSEPFVWFDDVGWREATVVGTDFHSDLAVLEIDATPPEATPLELVAEPVPVGTEVAAIGNPFELTGSFTTGVVSGRNRNIDVLGGFSIADGIQTDAPVNPGNSGGPLVTHDREVAGVVNAEVRGDNVGFAISARMTDRVVPALIEDGEFRHSRMGVLLRDVTPGIIEANELPVTWGVYIVEAQDGLPADGVLAGSTGEETVRGQPVETGGDVIVGLSHDGVNWPIPTTERLSAFLALYTDPGDRIDVEIIRNGERQTVQLELTSREGS